MPSTRSRTARWGVALAAAATVVASSLAAPVRSAGVSAGASPVDDATIQRAIDGFHSYVLRNAQIDPIVEPCPLLTPEQLGWYTQRWNVAPSTQGYAIDAGLNSDLGDNISLYCGVDLDVVAATPDPAAPYGIGLEVSYLLGDTSLDTVLLNDNGSVLVPAVATVGGVLGGWCDSGANGVCLLRWSRNELLISFAIVGPPSGVQQQAMIDMFAAMLPEMITNLGAAYQESAGTTTMPSLPPLPDNQPGVPATPTTTLAAPTTAAAPTTPAPATTAAPPTSAAAPTVPPVAATSAPAATTAVTTVAAPTVPPAPTTTTSPAPSTTVAAPTVPPTAASTTSAPVPTAPPPSPTTAASPTSEAGPDASVAADGSDAPGGADDVAATSEPRDSGDVAESSVPGGAPTAGLPAGALADGAAKIPAGTPGEIAVVMQSTPDSNGVSVVVRNDTTDPVYEVEVSGVARDAGGALVATGDGVVSPSVIEPGGWGMAVVDFGFDSLEGGEDIELAVTGAESEAAGDPVALTVTDAAIEPGGYLDELAGTARNDGAESATTPISWLACFDGTALTGVFTDDADDPAVAVGATTTFAIDVPSDVVCTSWVVLVEG